MNGAAASAGPPARPLDLTRLAAEHLASRGIEDARLDAELLLAHVLGVRRLDLYLQFERPLEAAEVAAYREAVRRRGRREPLQYITGEASFRELALVVDPRVLIPRPETEVLVGAVLEWAASRAAPVALDIGTGSGAIALSLLHEGPFKRVVATDVSEDALAVARANAERSGLADQLELRAGALWDPVGDAERFDVIVSNPPYVAETDRATLAPEIAEHEPAAALYGGADGLDILRRIVEGAGGRLRGGGLLAVEVGLGQAAAVAGWLERAPFGSPDIVKDLTGRERVVLAARDESADRDD
ncbi:MAG TPA: peptide chain release factor N(5)-glutamine methyltransferase [Longimicrobiales bacterium]|nr:peptide chain release factor N(5)-glutamine methyltransferase [Longimicrobiales bacterium]